MDNYLNINKGLWYNKYLKVYNREPNFTESAIFDEVRTKLKDKQSDNPLVTVSVIAYNEERNLLACLWSLSEMKTKYPIEIIGVNNNSTDRTENIFKCLEMPYYNEYNAGCGFARQCGLNKAKGVYHINIDADTMYPLGYVDIITETLMKPNVICASSLWSYIPDDKHSVFSLNVYETIRDIFLLFQSIKRPELSVRGLVFAYRVDKAKEIGIRTDIIRGEDGSLALALKKHGKIAFIRNRKARAVTGYGTVGVDGSLFNSFKIRFIRGVKSIPKLFMKNDYYKDSDTNLINKQDKK